MCVVMCPYSLIIKFYARDTFLLQQTYLDWSALIIQCDSPHPWLQGREMPLITDGALPTTHKAMLAQSICSRGQGLLFVLSLSRVHVCVLVRVSELGTDSRSANKSTIFSKGRVGNRNTRMPAWVQQGEIVVNIHHQRCMWQLGPPFHILQIWTLISTLPL